MTDHSDQMFSRLAVVCVMSTVLICMALYAYGFVNPDDEYKVIRSLVERLAVVTAGGCFIVLWLCIIDFVTPHAYLEKIQEAPIACAILGGAVVYSLGLIFVMY